MSIAQPPIRNSTTTSVVEVSAKSAMIAGGVIVVLLISVFWEWFRRQVAWASHEPSDWGHTLIIPFVSGYFVWMKRDLILAKPLSPSWIGIFIMVVGIAWYMFCNVGPAGLAHHNIRATGLGITLIGLGVLLLGWRGLDLTKWPQLPYLIKPI